MHLVTVGQRNVPEKCNQWSPSHYNSINHQTMHHYLLSFFLIPSAWACAQVAVTADSAEQLAISKSLDLLSEAAECWTPEQKKEFASVFFIERGKFTIPKEPIVLKSFEKP